MRRIAVVLAVLAMAGCTKTRTVYVPSGQGATPTTSPYCTYLDEPRYSGPHTVYAPQPNGCLHATG